MNLRLRHISLTRCLLGAGAAMLFASFLCAQAGPDGHWEGTFTANNREIGLSLDLAKNEKSEWVASMGVPSENLTGLVVMNVAVSGNSVKFVAVELRMAAFDLTLGPEGRMKGTVTWGQATLPVEFKRTGEARVELIPASPAVSKELEGDWEGSLDTGKGMVPVAIRFKNQPDKTVVGTFQGLPINDVKQTGQTVEFGIRVAHGSFQGTLNKEGTELTGQLTHKGREEVKLPLTLRKK